MLMSAGLDISADEEIPGGGGGGVENKKHDWESVRVKIRWKKST